MWRDADGFYFFGERAGDTFRWRGENVSTAEVEQTLSSNPAVVDGCCYGVATPHNDGKAGMVAVVLATCSRGGGDDNQAASPGGAEGAVAALHAQLAADLPDYAVPTFLRLVGAIPTTPGTQKHLKSGLAAEGFNVTAAASLRSEAVFVRQRVASASGRGGTKGYVRLTAELYAGILDGSCRL
eukprot:SAG22_NODE_845_length_6871_cov_3.172327_3_plen_183_part_00